MVPIAQRHLRPTVVSMYNYVQPVVGGAFHRGHRSRHLQVHQGRRGPCASSSGVAGDQIEIAGTIGYGEMQKRLSVLNLSRPDGQSRF